ncbi:MAG: hypothetical protein KDD10_18590, partial [Phaeodactylibacter sp.]|nr:hypothetical protein [Phaeodactylibacter sp.]
APIVHRTIKGIVVKPGLLILIGERNFQPVPVLAQHLKSDSSTKERAYINLPSKIGTYKTQQQGINFLLRIKV